MGRAVALRTPAAEAAAVTMEHFCLTEQNLGHPTSIPDRVNI